MEMEDLAGIVLAGGRSSRMGSPKAALEWHGSTLLRRVDRHRRPHGRRPGRRGARARAEAAAAARGRRGRGGRARGPRAAPGARRRARRRSTGARRGGFRLLDRPAVPPPRVRARRCGAPLDDGRGRRAADRARLPAAAGRRLPGDAARRWSSELLAADRLRPAFLFERCRVRRLDEQALLADRRLRGGRPRARCRSSTSTSRPTTRPRRGAAGAGGDRRALRRARRRRAGAARSVQAATLGGAAAAVGLELERARRGGDQRRPDRPRPRDCRWRRATRWRSCPRTRAADGRPAATSAARWSSTRPTGDRRGWLRCPSSVLRDYLGGVGLGTWLLHRLAPAGRRPARSRGAARVRLLAAGRHAADHQREVRRGRQVAADRDAQRRARLEPLRDRRQAHRPRRDRASAARPPQPSVLVVDGDGVRRRAAPPSCGACPAAEAERRLRERLGKAWRVAAIGPAGENAGPLRDDHPRRPPRRPRRPRRRARRQAHQGGRRAARRPAACRSPTRRRCWRPRATCARARSGRATAKYRELGTLANLLAFNRSRRCRPATSSAATFEGAPHAGGRGPRRAARCAPATAAPPARSAASTSTTSRAAAAARVEYENVFALGPLCGVSDPDDVLAASARAATSSGSTPSPPAARSRGRWSAPSAG